MINYRAYEWVSFDKTKPFAGEDLQDKEKLLLHAGYELVEYQPDIFYIRSLNPMSDMEIARILIHNEQFLSKLVAALQIQYPGFEDDIMELTVSIAQKVNYAREFEDIKTYKELEEFILLTALEQSTNDFMSTRDKIHELGVGEQIELIFGEEVTN